jgi:hypothetical protein
MGKENNICDFCELDIQSDSEFCPRCGTILIEDVFCNTHPDIEAYGVCVICAVACCEICGHSKNNVFLCNDHEDYEIYEGMARVFGASDEAQLQHIKGFLEQSELHPFIYSRKSSPMHLGGTDYSLFRASGDFDGHIINEIKLMVPCSEVLEAEKLISEINS